MKFKFLLLLICLYFQSFTYLFSENNHHKPTISNWIQYENYRELSKHISPVTILKYSSDGKFIFTISKDTTFRKWDNTTGKLILEKKIDFSQFKPTENDSYKCCDISNDGVNILIFRWYWKQLIPPPEVETKAYLINYNLTTNKVNFNVKLTYSSLLRQVYHPGPIPYIFGFIPLIKFSNDNNKIFCSSNLEMEYSYYTNNGNQSIFNGYGSSIYNSNEGYITKSLFSNNSSFIINSYHIAYDQQISRTWEYGLKIIRNNTCQKVYEKTSNSIFQQNNYNFLITNDNKTLVYLNHENGKQILNRWDVENNKLIEKVNFEYPNFYSANFLISNDDKYIINNNDSLLSIYSYPYCELKAEYKLNFLKNNPSLIQNKSNNEMAVITGDSILRIITIERLNQKLVAAFKADTTIIEAGKPLIFRNFSEGTVNEWSWDFGDGFQSIDREPTHVYTNIGIYTVKLNVKNNKESDSSIRKDYVKVIEPKLGSWINYESHKEQSLPVSPITILKYSSDGQFIYTMSMDTVLRKWYNKTGELIFKKKIDFAQFKPTGNDSYRCCDISSDGNNLLILRWYRAWINPPNEDTKAEVINYNLSTDKANFKINLPYSSVMVRFNDSGPPVYIFGFSAFVKFSDDNKHIYCSANLNMEYSRYINNGVQSIWNASTGIIEYSNAGGFSGKLAFSMNSEFFAYNYNVSYDDNLKLETLYGINIIKNKISNKIYNKKSSNLFFTTDNRMLAFIEYDNFHIRFNRYDLLYNKLLPAYNFDDFNIFSQNLLISKDDRFLVNDRDSILSIFQFPKCIKTAEYNFGFLKNKPLLILNPINNEIAVIDNDSILKIITINKLNQSLVAVFKADTTEVEVGKPLQFYEYSEGAVDKWIWDFGDGMISTEREPSHIYTNKGKFTVKLSVSNLMESDVGIRTNYITVFEPNDVTESRYNLLSEINISPNPVENILLIKGDNIQSIELYSVLGLKNTFSVIEQNNNMMKIDISSLIPGTYICKINSFGSKSFYSKILKI